MQKVPKSDMFFRASIRVDTQNFKVLFQQLKATLSGFPSRYSLSCTIGVKKFFAFAFNFWPDSFLYFSRS